MPKELLKIVRAPQESPPTAYAPEEQTEHGVCPPDELKELIGDQEEPTAVTKVTKAPNMKPEVAHAPEEEELNAVQRGATADEGEICRSKTRLLIRVE